MKLTRESMKDLMDAGQLTHEVMKELMDSESGRLRIRQSPRAEQPGNDETNLTWEQTQTPDQIAGNKITEEKVNKEEHLSES